MVEKNKMGKKIMPNLQRERIIEHVTSGKRFDGRELNEFRDIIKAAGKLGGKGHHS